MQNRQLDASKPFTRRRFLAGAAVGLALGSATPVRAHIEKEGAKISLIVGHMVRTDDGRVELEIFLDNGFARALPG